MRARIGAGPRARGSCAQRRGTPHADREREEFLATYGEAGTSSFFYHYFRLIEILYSASAWKCF